MTLLTSGPTRKVTKDTKRLVHPLAFVPFVAFVVNRSGVCR